MAIPNIVPRNNNDGETLGTAAKHWSKVYTEDVILDDVSLVAALANMSSGKVSKAGDILTGTIYADINYPLWRKGTDGVMVISGGENTSGACFLLYGKDASATGLFSLEAKKTDGTSVSLIGYPNGNLYWEQKQLWRSGKGCLPSENLISFTAPSSGSTYTAPCDGWVRANGSATANGVLKLNVNGLIQQENTISGYGYYIALPAAKGTKIKFDYSGIIPNCYFIYAQSEV